MYALFQLFTWLPLNVYLDAVLGTRMTSQGATFWWLLISAAVGAFLEEGGRWLGYRFVFPRIDAKLSWRNGVMYGLGHGSVETLLLFSGLTFVTMLAYVVLGQFDFDSIVQSLGAEGSPALIEALRSILDMQWSQPLIVAAERVLALPHQVAWSLMVMTSLFHRRKRWFAFALAYHTSVAVLVPSLATLAGFGVAEGVNLLLAVFSLWIISKLRAFEAAEPVR
ncbi:MAG: YhfC family intramembrane metalloprotease [Chloroflexi bacterium]|nr:YhfC family intramembrane metalloprotease [Chloroflexota bacterium]